MALVWRRRSWRPLVVLGASVVISMGVTWGAKLGVVAKQLLEVLVICSMFWPVCEQSACKNQFPVLEFPVPVLEFPECLNHVLKAFFRSYPRGVKEIFVNLFNAMEAFITSVILGKSVISTMSYFPRSAYMEFTLPPALAITSSAFLVLSAEMPPIASFEYFPYIKNFPILYLLQFTSLFFALNAAIIVQAFHNGLGKHKDDYQQRYLSKQSPIHHLSLLFYLLYLYIPKIPSPFKHLMSLYSEVLVSVMNKDRAWDF